MGNLARVFGPTIVGHSVPNPDPMTILQDTKRQPKVSQTKALHLLLEWAVSRNGSPTFGIFKIKARPKAREGGTRYNNCYCALCSGGRTPAVSASRILEPVCQRRKPKSPDH